MPPVLSVSEQLMSKLMRQQSKDPKPCSEALLGCLTHQNQTEVKARRATFEKAPRVLVVCGKWVPDNRADATRLLKCGTGAMCPLSVQTALGLPTWKGA